ncbi:unnamed protein product, partial [Pylaiella littoralis]
RGAPRRHSSTARKIRDTQAPDTGRRVAGASRYGRELQSRTGVSRVWGGHQRSWVISRAEQTAVQRAHCTKNVRVQLHGASIVPSNRASYQVLSTMASTDRDALVALYNATDGANWHQSTNWNIGDDLSLWHGIKVNDDGRVVELDLISNNLQGAIPKELGALGKLETLLLGRNNLTGQIPKELGTLSKLERLSLHNNQFSGHIPPELGNLAVLTILDLEGNKLSGTIPPELGNLAALKYLRLFHNELR